MPIRNQALVGAVHQKRLSRSFLVSLNLFSVKSLSFRLSETPLWSFQDPCSPKWRRCKARSGVPCRLLLYATVATKKRLSCLPGVLRKIWGHFLLVIRVLASRQWSQMLLRALGSHINTYILDWHVFRIGIPPPVSLNKNLKVPSVQEISNFYCQARCLSKTPISCCSLILFSNIPWVIGLEVVRL